jgi:hypothetical protein
LHDRVWLHSSDNEVSTRFSTETDVYESRGYKHSSTWGIKCNQIPSYEYHVTSKDISDLNYRPYASTDFVYGKTTARAGSRCSFGDRSLGYSRTSSGGGFWPPGTAVNPKPKSCTAEFPLYPAPEISEG